MTFIEECRGRFGVEPTCELRQVAPSTYYVIHFRWTSRREQHDTVLKEQICQIHKDNHEAYRVRKVSRQLLREGWEVGQDRVAQLIRELGLKGVVRGDHKRRTTVANTADQRPADLVPRQLSTAAPKLLWVADLTYVWTDPFVYTAFIHRRLQPRDREIHPREPEENRIQCTGTMVSIIPGSSERTAVKAPLLGPLARALGRANGRRRRRILMRVTRGMVTPDAAATQPGGNSEMTSAVAYRATPPWWRGERHDHRVSGMFGRRSGSPAETSSQCTSVGRGSVERFRQRHAGQSEAAGDLRGVQAGMLPELFVRRRRCRQRRDRVTCTGGLEWSR